jgi:hypothetical protein
MPALLLSVLALAVTAPSAGSATTTTADDNSSPWQSFTFWVSADGDDGHDGRSPGTAFRSVHRAQAAARSFAAAASLPRALEGGRPISIGLLPGTHSLDRPLMLTAADSGSADRKILWSSTHPEQRTSISGGVVVTGWAPNGTGVWAAPVPPQLAGQPIRQLWVNGHRANRSRVDGHALKCNITETGMVATATTDLDWGGNQADIEGVWRHDVYWVDSRCGVESVSSNVIAMQQPCWNNSIHKPVAWESFKTGPDFFENVYSAFSTPGQMYYDRSGGRILYRPMPDETLGSVHAVVPHLESLVQGVGLAHHSWTGITFEHATWLAPSSGESYVDMQSGACLVGTAPPSGFDARLHAGNTGAHWRPTPGNVRFFGSHDIIFSNCTFTHLGAFGLDFRNGTQNVSVSRCHFTDTSAGGISMGQFDDYEEKDPSKMNRNFSVTDNSFHDIPVEYLTTQPIFAGYIRDSVIQHNTIVNSSFGGISLGWGWPVSSYGGSNRIDANLIHNVTCCHIYVLSPEPGSVMSRNYMDGLYEMQLPALFLDQGSAGWNLTSNVIAHCGRGEKSEYKPTPSILMNFGSKDVFANETWVKNCSKPRLNTYGGQNASQQNRVLVNYREVDDDEPWPALAQEVIDQAGVRPSAHVHGAQLRLKTDDQSATAGLVEFDRRESMPPSWHRRAGNSISAGGTVRLSAVLKGRNSHLLEQTFWNVTNPHHERYAEYWSWDQLQAAFSPDRMAFERVSRWVRSIGGTQLTAMGTDLLSFSLSHSQMETAFGCTATLFQLSQQEEAVVRCGELRYSVASHIAPDLAMVEGLINFAAHASAWASPRKAASVDKDEAPHSSRRSNNMRAGVRTAGVPEYHLPVPQGRLMYGIGSEVVASAEFNAVAVYGPSYSEPDFEGFFSNLTNLPSVKGHTGGGALANNSKACGEPMLDMEMIGAFGYGAKPYQWHGESLFVGTLTSMMMEAHPPLVISYSYVEDIQSQTSLDANDAAVKKAALRGISVLGASGDSGAHCDTKHDTLSGHYNGFYPATSQYATGVGGSHARPADLSALNGSWYEDGSWGASSGGFFGNALYGYATPPYQKDAVSAYMALDTQDRPPTKLFNSSARGVPDVAALSSWVDCWCAGHAFEGGGTSASSPTFAGVVALLNDLRLKDGKPPLGFLNPFLYQHADAFHDMQAGDTCGNWTKGCNCSSAPGWGRGFPGVKGWDPSSGLGSPNYAKLKAAVLSLPFPAQKSQHVDV